MIIGSTVLRTRSPFWLRVNGVWCHLEGVRPGSSVSSERPTSGFTSVGGRRHEQVAPRVSREWSLDFEHATPEALTLLRVAAESEDVWLLDETAAAANMLDPRMTHGQGDGLPVLDCGGVPLRSLVSAESTSVSLASTANLVLQSTGEYFPAAGGTSLLASDSAESLIRFAIPPTPTGATLVSARLSLTNDASPVADDTIRVLESGDGWGESGGMGWPSWQTNPPVLSEAELWNWNTVDHTEPETWSIARIAAYAGSDLSLRLRAEAMGADFRVLARHMPFGPRLRLTYSHHAASAVVRLGRAHTFTVWTDADPSTVIGSLSGAHTASLVAPAGSGPRPLSVSFAAADDVLAVEIDPTDDYAVSGLQLIEGMWPGRFMAGERTPCTVSVADPEGTLNLIRAADWGLARGEWAVTLREVG